MSRRRHRAKRAELRCKVAPTTPFTLEAQQFSISSAISYVHYRGSYQSASKFQYHIGGQLGSAQEYSYPRFVGASDIEVKNFIVTGIYQCLRDVVEIRDEEVASPTAPNSISASASTSIAAHVSIATSTPTAVPNPIPPMNSMLSRLDAYAQAKAQAEPDDSEPFKW